MNRYSTISKGIEIFAIGIGITLANFITDWANQNKFDQLVQLLISLITVFFSYELITSLLKRIFENSRITRRFLLDRMFVEGVWSEVVLKNGEVFSYTLIYLSASDYSIRLTGESYDLKGFTLRTFRADMAEINWPTLQYKHSTQTTENSQRLEGYGELQFVERDNAPTRYNGFFMSLSDGIRYSVMGQKLIDKGLIESLDDIHEREKFFKNFWKIKK